MHGQSPASPEGGRYLSRVGGGVVALGQTGERHPWISFFNKPNIRRRAHSRHFSKCNCSLTGVPSAWQAQMCGGAALHSSRLQPLAVAHRTLEAGDRAPPPGVSSRVVSQALSCLVARVLWPGPRRLVARPSGPSPRPCMGRRVGGTAHRGRASPSSRLLTAAPLRLACCLHI